MKKENVKHSDYDASSIQLFEHIKAVQKRPGMYVGAGRAALLQIAYEIVTNSSDEINAGYGDTIDISINGDGSMTVKDNGRGIPWQNTKMPNGESISACILCAMYLHGGGKFGGENAAYSSSGGLNGVGLTACNALSSYFVLTSIRDGYERSFRCENGSLVSPLKQGAANKKTGTVVTFLPNPKYFSEGIDYKVDELIEKVRYLPYLNPGLKINITAAGEKKKISITHPGGLAEYIQNNFKSLSTPVFTASGAAGPFETQIAWSYNSEEQENIISFANTILTKSGGSHIIGFREAISRVLNKFIKDGGYLQGKNKDLEIEPDDCREGLKGIITVKSLDPNANLGFQSQTKDEITNPEIRKLVGKVTAAAFRDFLEADATLARKVVLQVVAAARGRLAAKRARERERKEVIKSDSLGLPAKLSDCHSINPELCEIFIVEGDSAGGSANAGRDEEFQAILPLRGKILNTENKELEKMLKNAEIKALVSAIGGGIGKEFDTSKIRYHKVIIMTDADLDGGHIRVLLLTFFWKWMRPLVQQGFVYIANPPLYRIKRGDKLVTFIRDEKSLHAWMEAEIRASYEIPSGWKFDPTDNEMASLALNGRTVQRIKGLGEMNAEDLYESTMKKGVRSLTQVIVPEGQTEESLDEHFLLLMGGDQSVPERQAFIIEQALNASVDL